MTSAEPITFSPTLASDDASANYWLRQVTVRLRREICWRWHERDAMEDAALPAVGSRLMESLDMTRLWEAKQAFFEKDATARFLSEKLSEPPAPMSGDVPRGSFEWVVRTLALDDVAAFGLALSVAASFDGAVGPVIGACLNDVSRVRPTLALAQRLWDRPEEVLALADPGHALWRHGLLQIADSPGRTGGIVGWDSALAVDPLVARRLMFGDAPLPEVFEPIAAKHLPELSKTARVLVDRLRSHGAAVLGVVPLCAPPGAPFEEMAHAISAVLGRTVHRVRVTAARTESPAYLSSLVALAWLTGTDLLLSNDPDASDRPYAYLAALRSIPATVYAPVEDPRELETIPADLLLPAVRLPPFTYTDRVAYWKRALGQRAEGLERDLEECARRFRYEKETTRALCDGLRAKGARLTAADLTAACRSVAPPDIGGLAQRVEPRFRKDEVILPDAQQRLFEEIEHAARSLTEVHYRWGTAAAWNEAGISILFAGPPGTGKTMAAEILAARLDVPMYRIDLSQVVNKYVGETEKNLKRVFDAADIADTILFFDEADALFGRRVEVRDAHDRYANLEVSYLLERMERFKGTAILATNRRKDIDEAFLRRLRYVLEFPIPGPEERKAIWQQVIPGAVDCSGIDWDFLARQFELAGGHIRSAAFNACLQTAGVGAEEPRLRMETVVMAIKREYDKLKRSVSLKQFGPYAKVVEEMGL